MEATATLKRTASHLATKWQQPYYRMCGYVNSRVPINFLRETHRYIRGSRVPAHKISIHNLKWEDGSGINIFR